MNGQLMISHHHKVSDKICNCTMCPIYKISRYDHGIHYCNYQHGSIEEPEICWCKVGIANMWMEKADPDQVLDFIHRISPNEKLTKN